jgi:hypothetical protein
MNLHEVALPGLSQMPIELVGEWEGGGALGNRNWWGVANCEQPILALGLIECEGCFDWVKSPKPASNSLPVRVYLGPYDDDYRDMQVALGFGSSGSEGPRSRTTLPNSKYRPVVPSRELRTGRFALICTVEGEPALNLWAMFLVQSDIRGARNSLWRVRRAIAEHFAAPWDRVLTYGRSGRIAP